MTGRRVRLLPRAWTSERGQTHDDDRGSESVELAILLPIGILVLAAVVVGARIALAGERISGVAGIAARDASLARAPADAQQAATRSAIDALRSDNLHCTDIRVDVDTSGFAAAPGTAASITVNVWCTVALSDVGVSGLPGSRTLHDQATSPLDPARDIPLGFGIPEMRTTRARRADAADCRGIASVAGASPGRRKRVGRTTRPSTASPPRRSPSATVVTPGRSAASVRPFVAVLNSTMSATRLVSHWLSRVASRLRSPGTAAYVGCFANRRQAGHCRDRA